MKIFLRIIAGFVLLIAVIALGLYVWGQPIQQVPGRRLRGDVVTQPVNDWTFVNQVGLCEIEVNPDNPRSVHVGCYGTPNYLYVSHTMAFNGRKSWADLLMENPSARVKFGDKIYPMKGIRVLDVSERQQIIAERRALPPPRPNFSLSDWIANKILGTPKPAPAIRSAGTRASDPPDNLWYFRLESR